MKDKSPIANLLPIARRSPLLKSSKPGATVGEQVDPRAPALHRPQRLTRTTLSPQLSLIIYTTRIVLRLGAAATSFQKQLNSQDPLLPQR